MSHTALSRYIEKEGQDRALNLVSPARNPTGGKCMPLIQVKLIENVFTSRQKEEMIKKLTDAMVSIEGENLRPVTWVVIEDVKSGDFGIGGQPMTTEAVKALASGKA
jgi:4-oxalocrotonate tautomerase